MSVRQIRVEITGDASKLQAGLRQAQKRVIRGGLLSRRHRIEAEFDYYLQRVNEILRRGRP